MLFEGRLILATEPDLPSHEGDLVSGAGLALAPGFIDMHSHADSTLPAFPTAINSLSQGVTTGVVGNCGWSPAIVTLLQRPGLSDLSYPVRIVAHMEDPYREITRTQREFVRSRSADLDERGWTVDYRDNLLQPLHSDTLNDFIARDEVTPDGRGGRAVTVGELLDRFEPDCSSQAWFEYMTERYLNGARH